MHYVPYNSNVRIDWELSNNNSSNLYGVPMQFKTDFVSLFWWILKVLMGQAWSRKCSLKMYLTSSTENVLTLFCPNNFPFGHLYLDIIWLHCLYSMCHWPLLVKVFIGIDHQGCETINLSAGSFLLHPDSMSSSSPQSSMTVQQNFGDDSCLPFSVMVLITRLCEAGLQFNSFISG